MNTTQLKIIWAIEKILDNELSKEQNIQVLNHLLQKTEVY